MTDEDVMEQAFLSALRRHFKKPGSRLPEILKIGETKTIPEGHVYEFWAACQTAALDLEVRRNEFGLATCYLVMDALNFTAWHPLLTDSGAAYVDSWVPDGTGGFDADNIGQTGMTNTSTSPHGWLLFGNDLLVNAGIADVLLLIRRRFDLET